MEKIVWTNTMFNDLKLDLAKFASIPKTTAGWIDSDGRQCLISALLSAFGFNLRRLDGMRGHTIVITRPGPQKEVQEQRRGCGCPACESGYFSTFNPFTGVDQSNYIAGSNYTSKVLKAIDDLALELINVRDFKERVITLYDGDMSARIPANQPAALKLVWELIEALPPHVKTNCVKVEDIEKTLPKPQRNFDDFVYSNHEKQMKQLANAMIQPFKEVQLKESPVWFHEKTVEEVDKKLADEFSIDPPLPQAEFLEYKKQFKQEFLNELEDAFWTSKVSVFPKIIIPTPKKTSTELNPFAILSAKSLQEIPKELSLV